MRGYKAELSKEPFLNLGNPLLTVDMLHPLIQRKCLSNKKATVEKTATPRLLKILKLKNINIEAIVVASSVSSQVARKGRRARQLNRKYYTDKD